MADHRIVNSDMYLHHHRGQRDNDILFDDGIRFQEKEVKHVLVQISDVPHHQFSDVHMFYKIYEV